MTTASTSAVSVIGEAARPPSIRHPSDLLRLLVAVVTTFLGLGLATVLTDLSEAVTLEVIEAAEGLPTAAVVVVFFALTLAVVLGALVAMGYLLLTRRWRRLLVGLLASTIAIGLVALVERFLVERFSPGLPFTRPSWICGADVADRLTLSCVPGAHPGIATAATIAGLVAFYATAAPVLNHRWRHVVWVASVAVVLITMLRSLSPPVDEFLALGIGFAVGAAILLLVGEPDRHPRGSDIAAGLRRSGIDLAEIRRASVDARGSVPYFAVDRDGRRIFAKVLGPEERAADVMFRVMRMFRLKGVGDERPFSSLKRGVEHEAVASLKARADGVGTPELLALVDVPPSSMLLAYEMIDGASLDAVAADELTDGLLDRIWEQVAILRRRRTAHRDLRLANVFLASDGTPWLIDFGFAELAATDGQLRSDVAELLVSTASVIGAERAVTTAVAGIGTEAVADASARVQPLALSGATRDALKHRKGLDADVRTEIQRQTGAEAVKLEDLTRVKRRSIATAVGLGLAMYFLIPQLAETDFGAVLRARWEFAPAILLASFLTYVGAAYNLIGAVPERVRSVPAVYGQFAATFINRITPAKVGGIATNVRFLQKNGVELSAAVAAVGVSNVSTIVIHLSSLVVAVVFVGRHAADFIRLPSEHTVLLGLVAIFTLSGVAFALPRGRRIMRDKAWPAIARSGRGLRQVAGDPTKALMLFGGALLMIVASIVALSLSLTAFDGVLGISGVALVFLGGQALGNLAPTPGGIGATEAAMIAAFTALGVDAATAVPTVFLYRIATFWLPILPGAYALRKLERDGLL